MVRWSPLTGGVQSFAVLRTTPEAERLVRAGDFIWNRRSSGGSLGEIDEAPDEVFATRKGKFGTRLRRMASVFSWRIRRDQSAWQAKFETKFGRKSRVRQALSVAGATIPFPRRTAGE